MFIFTKWPARIVDLHKRVKLLTKYSAKDFKRMEEFEKRLKDLEKYIGKNRPRAFMSIYEFWPSLGVERKAKPFNLTQKMDAIMDHLGLEEQITAETKLIKKPVKKKKTSAKKKVKNNE